MKIFKINNMSTSGAIILGSVIVGLSIFLTTWVFFGGDGNRLKLSAQPPTQGKPPTPDEIKKLQEQRAEQMKRNTPTPPPVVVPTPTEE